LGFVGLEFTSLDDTNGNGLLHVSNGESTERGEFREDFTRHGLGGFHGNDTGITRFQELGHFFNNGSVSSIDLAHDFSEFTGDMGSMAIDDWGVTVLDLTGMVHNDDLSLEGFNLF
jgi:hypothetical protein